MNIIENHSVIFSQIYSHCQNFSWNQSSKPLLLLLKLKYCLEKKHYRDCNEYIRLSLDFILAAKIETKRIDLLEAEQIALELSKFQSSIKIYLYSSVQMFQLIYVVQCVYFYAISVKLAQICAKLVKIWIPWNMFYSMSY